MGGKGIIKNTRVNWEERMMKRNLCSWLCFVLAVMVVGGCGYTTRSALPSHFSTIHIEAFKNSINYTEESGRTIYFPLLEVKARDAVIDRFLVDGNLRTAEADAADLILRAELTKYSREALRYTDNEDVQEYRVRVTTSLELWDPRKREVVWSEPSFAGEATYFVSGTLATSEESAVANALVDLARRIVERTIENW